MEQLLLPLNPTSPLAKVPYVGREKYDGLPFLTYAKRKGKLNYGEPTPDIMLIHRDPHDFNPMHHEEEEAFLQTWLFFGLLSEFFLVNAKEESPTTPEVSSEQLDKIYSYFIYEEEGKKYITTDKLISTVNAQAAGINAAITAARDKEVERIEEVQSLLRHLGVCMRYTSAILNSCADSFNPDIKLSIAAMCESLIWIIQSILEEQKMEKISLIAFKGNIVTAQMHTQMLTHGWCPSDIAKCKKNFGSVQAIHMVSKMDKAKIPRKHSSCSDRSCNAGQIGMSDYKVDHVKKGCTCEAITIENHLTVEILKEEHIFPVLKLYGGKRDVNNLKVDVVKSDEDIPFVAISHVWVDGMGNYDANSLYRCQLAQLRDLVEGIKEFAPKEADDEKHGVLLWLDTLCCPVRPESAKNLALEKIQNVYKGASCVLVLDASLRSYCVGPMTVYEALLRISTSGWTRRLWTLQEGALAKTLLFQFADQCVSLKFLYDMIHKKYKTSIYLRGLNHAVRMETDIIRAFFYGDQFSHLPIHLSLLAMALDHRKVTVPTDEPLCIGTLLSLNLQVILSVPEEHRMYMMWEQLAKSEIGIPAAVIFFTGRRLDKPGFRWAPSTILNVPDDGVNPDERLLLSNSASAEGLTGSGLKVRFPGYRIKQKKYEDGLPHDPWLGSLKDLNTKRRKRIAEVYIDFRDGEGLWFRVGKQETSQNGRVQTSDKDREWRPDMEYPLFDISATGRCALLFQNRLSSLRAAVGLVVSYRDKTSPGDTHLTDSATSEIHVLSESHILIMQAQMSQKIMLSACERIATELRSSELTWKLCAIQDQDSDEYQRVMNKLTAEMRRRMKEALDADPKLVDAVNANGDGLLDHVWKYVANWYRQDVFIAEKLPDDQVWVVD